MKIYKKISFLSVVTMLLAISVPSMSQAQSVSPSTLNTLRAEVETRVQNVKANQEIRKNTIEERRDIASTSREVIKDIRVEARGDIKAASSTTEKRDIRNEMRRDVFIIQQQRVVKQLELSIQNLKQVRDRIDSRIKKEQANGKDMSEAIKMLATADAKVLAAKTALQAFKDYIPKPLTITSSTLPTTGTSPSINPETARQMVTVVQKAIRDAQKSLNDVVVSIAHSMGLKLGTDNRIRNSTSTPSSTSIPVPSESSVPSTTPIED